MDFAPIVRQIDAEIARLERIREIVASLRGPALPALRVHTPTPAPVELAPPPPPAPVPQLIVLPPRQKREYHRRAPRVVQEPKALSSAPAGGPVFVPKAVVAMPKAAPAQTAEDSIPAALAADALEAAVRRNLLHGGQSGLA